MGRTWISNQVRRDLSFFDPAIDTTVDAAADTIGGVPDGVTVSGTAGSEMPLSDHQPMAVPASPDPFQTPATSGPQATASSPGLQIVDIIPNSDSAESAQNSEPSLAINPLNPAQMIAGAFSN